MHNQTIQEERGDAGKYEASKVKRAADGPNSTAINERLKEDVWR